MWLFRDESYETLENLAGGKREHSTRLKKDVRPSSAGAFRRILQHSAAHADEREKQHDLDTHHERTQERSEPTMSQILQNKLVDQFRTSQRLKTRSRLAREKVARHRLHRLVFHFHALIQSAHRFFVDAIGKHG